MKLLRSLFLLSAICLSAFGATPSFDSFSTNDFTVTKVTAPWVITSKRTGVTNVYNNSYVTYSNSFVTITNSTLVITNTTIIFNGQTNVIGPRVWTNNVNNGIVSVVDPYNHVYVSNFYNGGWNVEFSKTVVLTNGTNVVRSDLYAGLLVLGSTTNSADAIVQFNAGPYPGATLKIQSPPGLTAFTVPNNFAVVGGGVTIMNGDWVGGTNQVLRMSFDGWNWKEEGRYVQGGPPPMFGTNYWTNIAGVLQPVDLTLPLMISNTFTIKNGANTLLLQDNGSAGVIGTTETQLSLSAGADSVTLGFGQLRPNNPNQIDVGDHDVAFKDAWFDGGIYAIGFNDFIDYSRLKISHTGTNGVIKYDSQSSGVAGLPRAHHFDTGGQTITTGNLLEVGNNGTNKHTIAWNGAATFGNFLVVTNNASDEGIITAPMAGLELLSAPSWGIGFSPGGSFAWQFDFNGNLLPSAGATYNIGVQSDGVVLGAKTIAGLTLVLSSSHTPANSSETNYAGAIAYDSSYLYVWTATNVNKRISLSTW